MARERSLDGNARRLEISDLADHDDVRILTEERPERGRERHSDFRSHEHLIDSEQVVLDWIFRRHDVDVDVVHLRERRVQRRRFSRARRDR